MCCLLRKANSTKLSGARTVFEFPELPEAFKYLEGGTHFGKICIRV